MKSVFKGMVDDEGIFIINMNGRLQFEGQTFLKAQEQDAPVFRQHPRHMDPLRLA